MHHVMVTAGTTAVAAVATDVAVVVARHAEVGAGAPVSAVVRPAVPNSVTHPVPLGAECLVRELRVKRPVMRPVP
jgi:hypothetical protein